MIKKYFFKLIKGEIPLKYTFWIYLISISILLELFFNLFIEDYSFENKNRNLELIFYIIGLIYSIFIFIAVIRSANNYKGSKVWSFFAKVAVGINLFLSLSIFIEICKYYFLEDYAVTKEIRDFKKNLPLLIDMNTELIDVNKEDKIISYTYKFYNFDKKDVKSKKRLKKQIQNFLCEKDDTLDLLKKDYILNYIYVDKKEDKILNVKTEKSACGKGIYDLDILREILTQRGEL